jgi:hypothetical protein
MIILGSTLTLLLHIAIISTIHHKQSKVAVKLAEEKKV